MARERQPEALKRHYADLIEIEQVKAEEITMEEAFNIGSERQHQEEEDARLRDDHVILVSTNLAQAIKTLNSITLNPFPGGESIYSLFDQRKARVSQPVNKETLAQAGRSRSRPLVRRRSDCCHCPWRVLAILQTFPCEFWMWSLRKAGVETHSRI